MKLMQIIDVYNRAVGAQKVYDAYSLFCKSENIDLDRYTIYKSQKEDLNCIIDASNSNSFIKILQQLKGAKKLSRIIKYKGYEKIVSFLDRSNVMSIMAAKGKTLVVATVHNPPTVQYQKLGRLKTLVFKLLRFYYNKKNVHVIAVSKQVKQSLEVIGVKNVKIVYNPLVVNENTSVSFDIKESYLVAVGRLSYQKAHWKLVKAVSILKAEYNKKVHLVVMGDGMLLKKTKELAYALDIQDLVYFMGFVENPLPIIEKASCMIFSSYFEGFPITVLEAFHCNCPVIGTQIALPEEIRSEIPFADFYYENQNVNENFDATVFEEDDYKLAEIMNQVLEQPVRLKKIAEIGHSWVSVNCGIDNFKLYE